MTSNSKAPAAAAAFAGKPAPRTSWDSETIRRARKTPLPEMLRKRGYPLRELPKQNFLVEDHEDLVVKDHYWNWRSRGLKGNAIDFLILVECLTFDEAMEALTGES